MSETSTGTGNSTPPTEQPNTVLVEVKPGVAVLYGDKPEHLELFNLGLLSKTELDYFTPSLTITGQVAQVGGTILQQAAQAANNANLALPARGLFQIDTNTLKLLDAGASLAGKDGANLGAIFQNGKVIGQARFIPVAKASQAAQVATVAGATVTSLGNAATMIAMQMQLAKIEGLQRQNLALGTMVYGEIKQGQRAELTALCNAISAALAEAEHAGQVTQGVWDGIGGKNDKIDKMRITYRDKIQNHIRLLEKENDASTQRSYLEQNAEDILADSYSLLKAQNAWFQYQGLRVNHLRYKDNADEQKLIAKIGEDALAEYTRVTQEINSLLGRLNRAIGIKAAITNNRPALSRGKKDAKTVSAIAQQLLAATNGLATSIGVPKAEIGDNWIACGISNRDQYADMLQWVLMPDEQLLALARVQDNPTGLLRNEELIIAVTTHRILLARRKKLLASAEFDMELPYADIRYVRQGSNADYQPLKVQVITPTTSFDWLIPASLQKGDNAVMESKYAQQFVALLGSAMHIPEAELAAFRAVLPPEQLPQRINLPAQLLGGTGAIQD